MRNRRGEITTILMLGTLVVIGVTAVISSFTVKDKKTTSSRASEVYCIYTTKSSCENLAKVGDCPNTGTVCSVCKNGKYRCPLTKDDSYVAPTLAPCSEKKCTSGTGEPYWVKSSKNYSDDKCNEVISKPINDWCKGSGLIPIPSKTPVPSTINTKTYCSGTTGTYYYKCTNGNYVDSTCNKEKIPDVNKWCIPTILTSPTPSQDNCTKGQYFVGTGGYNMETPEQICDANNGVYVGSSQQGKVGEQRWACCSVSNSSPNATCPKPGLGYACCVVDSRCDNDTNRYRWYGCTGQVCSATIISTKGGPGHLVDCPYGVNKQNQESCESALTPPKLPSVNCTDYGSYGLLGGCREKCGAGYECKSAEGDASGERRFCCPPPPETPPPATDDCEKKFANCLEAYKKYQGANKFSYYKSKSGTGANIYSSGDGNNCTQSTWNEIANYYCKGTPLTEVPIVPGEDPKGSITPDMTVEPDPTMVALSCSTDICTMYEGQVGNNSIVYHNTTTDRYYKSDKKTELSSYGLKASYCKCGNLKPTEAPNTTDYSKEGWIYMYYNCIQDHNTEAPYIACWSGACDKYTNNSKCYIKGTDLYCCGSRRTE